MDNTDGISRLTALREMANKLPLSPGVYLMKDRNGKIIYVGKSKALKNRVTQYFTENVAHTEKTRKMISHVASFDFIITGTESEALNLENKLIKLHTPKFNIKLKDAKSYPYIKVTLSEPFPRLLVVRSRLNDGAKYFGPYSGTGVAYSIVDTVRRTFRLPSCKKTFPRDLNKGRPCLNYQIGKCSGVCSGNISQEEYRGIISDALAFLNGASDSLSAELGLRMEKASEELRFEEAAILRDRINGLKKLREKQRVLAAPGVEQDIFGFYSDEICSCISVFYIRDGALTDSESTVFPAEQILSDETLVSFIYDLYAHREFIPREILTGFPLPEEDTDALGALFSEKAGYKVRIRQPERGNAKGLCDMVAQTAKQHAVQFRLKSEGDEKTLVRLASMLGLEVVPERIEAYDISNLGSEHITAGRITVSGCKFDKSGYRTYSIKSKSSPDDYSAMREALDRRLNHTEEDYPDLILLDGGRGHVSVIRELFDKRGIDIPVFGMVKDDYHKTRALTTDSEEISIARDQTVFQFIYRIQEEVHRYTVGRMSGAKRKTLHTSALEKINGIGPSKARLLLNSFGSINAIKNADENAISAVKGISARNAADIYRFYHGGDNSNNL